MPALELTRSVTVTVAGPVDLAGLEQAALEFARTAPAQLIDETIDAMVEALLDDVVGPAGLPIPGSEERRPPWVCPGCGVLDEGFARRGSRSTPRAISARCGKVAFNARMVQCLACECRFSFVGRLLGLRPHQRRSDELARHAAGLATEVGYAKAERLLDEQTGVRVSGRTIRDDVDVALVCPRRASVRQTSEEPGGGARRSGGILSDAGVYYRTTT